MTLLTSLGSLSGEAPPPAWREGGCLAGGSQYLRTWVRGTAFKEYTTNCYGD